jgi:hypothetical protein
MGRLSQFRRNRLGLFSEGAHNLDDSTSDLEGLGRIILVGALAAMDDPVAFIVAIRELLSEISGLSKP